MKLNSTADIELDNTDKKIINALQNNARLSNVELAEQINLSPSACLRRTKFLMDNGVFDRFVGLLNRELFHVQGTAFIFISLDIQSEAVFAEFEIAAAQLEQVMECYLMAGDTDYMLKVVYTDAKDYEELYYKKLLRLPGVVGTQTRMALRQVHSNTSITVT
ncbi:MAG: Lrp/AsnC family transcriptional regulator [Pseudomonadales bacterium]|jgi:Lrp/AsnC family leucine-responsive transcriptional regulator